MSLRNVFIIKTYTNFSLAQQLIDVQLLLKLNDVTLDLLDLVTGHVQLPFQLHALLHLMVQQSCNKQ